jgi:glutaredoxin
MNLSIKKTISLVIIFLALIGLLIPWGQVNAQTTDEVNIYLFWGDGCPHCAKAKPFLEDLAKSNPNIKYFNYEIYYNDANQEIFRQVAQGFGFEPRSVPTIFIGEKYWEGYSDEIRDDITRAVEDYLANGSRDKVYEILNGITPTQDSEVNATPTPESLEANEIKIPLFGKVDLSQKSLFLSTLLIAFVDGVNPCSIWVLTMLLAITLHTGSRKKVLLIGIIFLSVTAAVYALFIAGLFTVLKVVSFIGWIQVVVALVALFFALVNIKDYFWYKQGLSFTIDDKHKPGIYQRMRKLMDAGDSFWGLVGGTVVMAAGVSLVEFSCTAGFPVLWTNLVSAQQVTAATFVLLLLTYMLIYQLDEMVIFFTAVFTLKSNKLEEKHGRILKLIGGILMLTLAVVMLVKPSLMSDLSQSLIIFGIAFVVTLLVLLLHRVILPKFGVYLGSEYTKKKQRKK